MHDFRKMTKSELIGEIESLQQRGVSLESKAIEAENTITSLQERTIFLQAMLDSLPFEIWAGGADGKYVLQNAQDMHYWGNNLGKSADELDGWPEELLAQWKEGNRRVFNGEQIREDAERMVHGEKRYFTLFIGPICAGGKTLGIVGANVDTTERVKAEIALRSSEERYRLLFESNPSPMWVFDVETLAFLAVNQAAIRHYGYSREEFLSMTLRDIRPLEDVPALIEDVKDEKSGLSERGTWRHFKKDGTLIDVEITSHRVDWLGRDAKLILVNDVTERKQAQELIRLRLGLLDYSATHSMNELLQKALDEIGELTRSPIGFFHFVHADEKTLSLQTWSTRTLKEYCKAQGEGLHYPVEQAGVWVDCVGERRPVIHNDYLSLPHRKGLPEGHAQVIRELVVPILKNGRIVAILGVGNKPQNYDEKDVELVSYLADVTWEISKRKQVEELVQESEEKYRSIVENALAGIFTVNNAYQFVYANDELCKVLGYTREQILGMDFRKVLSEDCRDMVAERYVRRQRGEVVPSRYETSIVRGDGEIRFIEMSVTIVNDKTETPLTMGQLVDITERKQAEQALRESQQMLKLILDTIPVRVFWKTSTSQYLGCNQPFANDAGLSSPDEIIGKNDFELAWKEQAEMYRADDRAVSETCIPRLNYEEPQTTPNGETRWLRTSKVPLIDALGQVRGMLGTYEDITEHKQAADELKRKTEELERFFSVALDLLCIADMDGYFRRLNPQWEAVFGYSTPELEGQPFLDFVHPDDRASTLAAIGNLSAKKPVLGFVNRYRCKDNSYRWLEWRSYPVGDLIYAAARDITEHKRSDERIKQLNEELEQRVVERTAQLEAANKELESFSYSVSHDLRAPLRAIDGFSRILIEEHAAHLPAEANRLLEIVRSNTHQMGLLIDGLLAFSRLSRHSISKRIVDMEDLVRQVLETLQSELKGRKVEIEVGDLPACRGDPTLLKQVWMNLLANAFKFTREKKTTRLKIGYELKDGKHAYFIKDNGTGFDMQYADKLFGVFQRLHHSDQFEGTGVGLAIVQRIVQRHGGHVWAESEPDAGATFYFSL